MSILRDGLYLEIRPTITLSINLPVNLGDRLAGGRLCALGGACEGPASRRSAKGGLIAPEPSVRGLGSSVVDVAKGAKPGIEGGRDLSDPMGNVTSPECGALRIPDMTIDSVSSAEFWAESEETRS